MVTFARRLVLRSLLLAALVPVAASAQAPKPVPGQPFQYWDVEDIDGGARRVYFRNDSPAPITITQLVITRCDNTLQNCGTFPANLVVAPGKTVMAFKVERLDKKLGWRFGYSFRTAGQPAVAPVPPPQSLTMGGPGGGAPMTLKNTALDSLVPSVTAFTGGASCGKVRVPDLPPGHRVLFMVFGTAEQPTARRVMVRLDTNGSPYDVLDIRQDPADTTSTARRTQITIDLVRQSVIVMNSGGGQPATAFRATGTTLLTATSLGMPGETIARMVKECGGS